MGAVEEVPQVQSTCQEGLRLDLHRRLCGFVVMFCLLKNDGTIILIL